jgi:hypothetical protein
MFEGIALLPAYVADNPRPGLCYVAVDDLPAFIPLALVCKAGESRPMVNRAFELMLARLGEKSAKEPRKAARRKNL